MTRSSRVLRHRVWKFISVSVALLLFAAGAVSAGAIPAFQETEEIVLRFEGEVLDLGPDKWLVGNFGIFVDTATVMLEERGKAELGAWVIVSARDNGQGGFHADVIEVDRPANVEAPGIQFSGPLEKRAGSDWVVAGTLFEVTEATEVIGPPSLGALLRVNAETRGPILHATRVEVIASDSADIPLEFEGRIEAIAPDLWNIEGSAVAVISSTIILGEPQVGKDVEVEAVLEAGETLVARLVRMVDEPQPVHLGALVQEIRPGETGAETWQLLVFSDYPWVEPVVASANVGAGSLVDERRAVGGQGTWVDVWALRGSDGSYQVESVRVEQPVPVQVFGVTESFAKTATGSGWWQVNGRPVYVPEGVQVVEEKQRDNVGMVKGLLLGNGVIYAGQLQAPQGAH